jgi:hypothetical protein
VNRLAKRFASPRAGADVATTAGETETLHKGKYRQISAWLAGQEGDDVRASFRQIEEVLGLPLPASCRNHVPLA